MGASLLRRALMRLLQKDAGPGTWPDPALGVLHDAGFGSCLAMAASGAAHSPIVLESCHAWVWKVLEMDWRSPHPSPARQGEGKSA
jgi:hypothetical protein